jgi:hypothetical protein
MSLVLEQPRLDSRGPRHQPAGVIRRHETVLRPCRSKTGTRISDTSNPQGRVKARSSSSQPLMPVPVASRNVWPKKSWSSGRTAWSGGESSVSKLGPRTSRGLLRRTAQARRPPQRRRPDREGAPRRRAHAARRRKCPTSRTAPRRARRQAPRRLVRPKRRRGPPRATRRRTRGAGSRRAGSRAVPRPLSTTYAAAPSTACRGGR